MNEHEREIALYREASDLFDELSVVSLDKIDEDIRQKFRKIFVGGYLIGWGSGHMTGMAEAVEAMLKDRKNAKKKSI